MAEVPESVQVRGWPGQGYRQGFRIICPRCSSHVWVDVAKDREGDDFAAAPCPECDRDIRLALNVALADRRLAGLRHHLVRLSARPR